MKNISYQWYRNDVNVHHVTSQQSRDDDDDNDDLEGRLSVYPDGSLVIAKVRRTDSGLYKCRPGTGFALPSEAVAYLNVTCK